MVHPMVVEFVCATCVTASPERAFDLARDVDAHVHTMAWSGERAVSGVTAGRLELGDEVTWKARHLGVPWRMTVRITEFDRPRRFVDEQVDGPFRHFRHEHVFERDGRQVVMRDAVRFAAPFGAPGRAAERLLSRYLQRLVCERSAALGRLMGE